jgi:aminoglycoside phosphotransferase (APT) family kinase protein
MDEPSRNSAPSDETRTDDLHEAARALIPDATEIAMIEGHPGITRVSSPSGLWKVRRWPPETPERDAVFSHEVMAMARDAGIAFAPEVPRESDGTPREPLRLRGRLYTAQRWLPGELPPRAEIAWPGPEDRIDIPAILPAAHFIELATTVANLHSAAESLAARRDAPAAPLSMLPGAVQQAQGLHLRVLRPKSRHEPAIQRWLAMSERLLATASPIVSTAAADRSLPTSVLHLGLWPAHVLIDNGALSGLLGWERVAVGSPLLDLAQAILRLQGWNDDAVETAVGAYSAVRDLAPGERRILPAVAALDAVATTGRLLQETYGGRIDVRPPTPLRGGIELMLDAMTALDRNLNAPAKRRRTWVRREGQPPHRPKGGKPRERRQ